MASFNQQAAAPSAKKTPARSVHHGVELIDDYAWLRAGNWQKVMQDPDVLDGEIRAHLEAENAYQAALMAETEPLQKSLVAEMRGRIKEDDSSVPMKDGDWAYGVRYFEGAEHPQYVREPAVGGDTVTILDGEHEAEGKSYFRIAGLSHSPDHQMIAWAYDDKGSEYFDISFRNLETGKAFGPVIADTGGGGVWSKGADHFFYTRVDENHRPSKLFCHALGSETADRLVYEELDPGFFMSAGKSQSGDQIIIDIHDHQTSECWLIPADQPDAEPRLIAARTPGVEYSVDEGNGVLYILTNIDDCEDFKIVTATVASPGVETWREFVPHEPGRLILAHSVYANHLVWLERKEGLPRLVVRRLSDGEEHVIAFDEEAYSLGFSGAYEFDTEIIRFTYSSLTTPVQTFEYNLETRERRLIKTQEVPSGHDPDNYAARRIEAVAEDGEKIPVSLIHHKDTPLDGTAPCLLYGYGAYGISIPAGFNTNLFSLVDRGFVYAIAHVRGGKDKGFDWYRKGKLEHKTNTFSDFLACGEHLAEQGFTARGRIIAQGGSAGGMLMGVIANERPDLFAGIIAEVPFVDVLNTMLDDTLPLTPPEWPEWGNPIASEEDFRRIASYSPYENVKRQAYPPILALAGLTDPRVTYWEPAKWVARLRELKSDANPVMLKTNMDAGHGGSSGRFKRLEEIALGYAFALAVSEAGTSETG